MKASKAEIAVFVSGGGTNLQALIDAQKSGIIEHGEIKLVVSSNPNAYALERAAKAGIKSVTVSKKEFGSQAVVEEKITEILEENNIDLIILAGYMSILSADFTRRYERRIINVHPSLIPSFCDEGFYGLRVHEAALKKGVKVTGATVHFVNEIPDGGEIIMQKAVKVRDGDTPETLQRRILDQIEHPMLVSVIRDLCADKIR